MNKNNLILIVLGAAAVLAVGMAVFAVLRNRQPAVSPLDRFDEHGAVEVPVGIDDDGGPIEETRAICGDGICTAAESVDICWSDCVDYGSFSDISLTNLSAGQVEITWKTSKPMTSAVDYGFSESYELGSVSDSQLLTDHRLLTVRLNGSEFFFRLRGTDGEGNEESFSSLGNER
ncbi:hypothetical protein COY93_02085 [Candidatus Uhrbacteria bacterium CG_4_10_14_0_8_um_filter_58_22]|uniref:Fibronectin type-III domain-containing protein n=1 Tax=Candidatus Uhrbacteria bacterium CG_4_10_14_0_8_um_filter_58_22 TaxID=1975029 RepID=A0A2M7QAV4_9BACT|nr:MAG: hypothetical protein AUJ19_01340 [Parcubacteria group bacterium CG1_02_58_44]PIY62767.1 MAG: hypothetical protein COY93_02085 [Candidatus Uhrbacteria bacterium CG_4_10_14_0_8_um_filter_58_22]